MNFPEKVIWDEKKNELLMEERKISFEEVKRQMEENEILDLVENLSSNHCNQHVLIFKYNDYIWNCPCIIEEDKIILKTIFPNRKSNNLYL